MAELPSWTDIIGPAGLLAGLGAIVKTVLDARKDSGKARHDSEGELRGDLRAEIARQATEITSLRKELADARKEMNRIADDARKRLRECEDRAITFQQALIALTGEVRRNAHGRDTG